MERVYYRKLFESAVLNHFQHFMKFYIKVFETKTDETHFLKLVREV